MLLHLSMCFDCLSQSTNIKSDKVLIDRNTIKTKVFVNKTNGSIICTNFTNGKKHDFKLFRWSKVMVNYQW